MSPLRRSKSIVTAPFGTLSALALVGLQILGSLPSRGANSSPVRQEKAEHFPVVMLAGDAKNRIDGKVFAIDSDRPGHINRVLTGAAGPVSYLQWTDDHQYLILLSGRGLFLSRYDRRQRSFAPPVPVATPGADKSIRWPGGIEKKEQDVENKLRLKILQTLQSPPGDTLAWSRDRTQIAFTIPSKEIADSAGEVYEELWVAQVDNLQLKHLGHGAHPSWSPDGHYLVAIDGSEFYGRRILRYDLAHNRKQVLRSGHLECFAIAKYSATGNSIAVFGGSDPAHEYNEGVFLLDRNGRLLRNLAPQQSIGLIAHPVVLVW